MKRKTGRLTLSKETLRRLEEGEIAMVVGGNTVQDTCTCPTLDRTCTLNRTCYCSEELACTVAPNC